MKLQHWKISCGASIKRSFSIIVRENEDYSKVASTALKMAAKPIMFTNVGSFICKQSTPERLTGRELLRRYGMIDHCKYNSKEFCKRCPDCIFYGFAIGDKGSEHTKVIVDSAFSVSLYDTSHQTFTFNAPFEN